MKINYIIYLMLCLFFGQSCYESKGNYDYMDINNVSIDLPKSYFSNIRIGDSIPIVPTITFKYPNDTSYFYYEWYLDRQLVANTRNFNSTWNKLGSTIGEFHVIDTLTHSRYIKKFEIDQITPYQFGWMVLYEKNGESEFCYIQESENKFNSFIDLYKERNGTPLGSSPVRMVEHYSQSSSEILVIQRGGQGCVEINGQSLLKTMTTQLEFLDDKLPNNFVPINASYSGYINYIQNENGQVFSRQANPNGLHTARYSPLPLADSGQELNITHLIQTVDAKTYFSLLFDKTNNRFLGVITQSSVAGGKLTNLFRPTYPEDVIPLDNIQNNQLIYAAAYMEKSYLCDFVAIFKDPTNQYLLQEFQIEYIPVGYGLEVKDIKTPYPAGNGLFHENSLFHLTKKRPYLFFTAGANSDQIHYLDLATRKIHLYKDFKGEQITTLCTNNNSQKMGVGLANGQFFIFDISDQWLGREIKQIYFQDHLGKIVHAIYKFGTKSNHNN